METDDHVAGRTSWGRTRHIVAAAALTVAVAVAGGQSSPGQSSPDRSSWGSAPSARSSWGKPTADVGAAVAPDRSSWGVAWPTL